MHIKFHLRSIFRLQPYSECLYPYRYQNIPVIQYAQFYHIFNDNLIRTYTFHLVKCLTPPQKGKGQAIVNNNNNRSSLFLLIIKLKRLSLIVTLEMDIVVFILKASKSFFSADEKHRTAFWIQNTAFKKNVVISLILNFIFILFYYQTHRIRQLDCSVNMTQY